ncbi:MAG: hydantoinase B/oxoprolinase family protein [Myxococcota bacterium]
MGRVSIDTGGTFTDLLYHDDGRVIRLKVPSRPSAPDLAIVDALEALRERAADVVIDELRHGTTVATNALLERKGARTLFVTTSGFEDLLELRRQNRPVLYALHPELAPPLACDTLGIEERIGPDGSIERALGDVDTWIRCNRNRFEAAESVAVCLLHSYINAKHEQIVAAALRQAFPDTPVTVSSELIPLFREYERASTVAVNAYVAPVMSGYLSALRDALTQVPISVMGSSGGLMPLSRGATEPVHTVLSGPAGGVRGALLAGRRNQRSDLLTLDMGGTSTDVSVVVGDPLPDDSSELDGNPLRVPILPIETVGAGGGSIARLDAAGALQVGPESAGAMPGPACYGRGGVQPTVTDAHVVLGRIESLLGGAMELDADAAHTAVGTLADRLAVTVTETAEAIIAIAEANMARACKRVSMDRGVDPRGLTLVAFGGAGGLHACALADALGCHDVLFPREPGVLSAEGISASPAEASATVSILSPLDSLDEAPIEQARATALERLERSETGEGPVLRTVLDCRYRGQTYSLPIEVERVDRSTIRAAFIERHEERYGYHFAKDRPLEVTSVRVFATQRARLPRGTDHPAANLTVEGPNRVTSYGATLWVPLGWRGIRTERGDWRVERHAPTQSAPASVSPLAIEVHRQQLAAIAEEMGSALMRSAFSSNIKERRDFSCAVFDRDGNMLAQAAHIPVHLGSQPLSVKAAINAVRPVRGQTVVLNAPFAGGTHLPDVTLVTPVFLEEDEEPHFYVSNRAHHADIGGISPGSMPSPRRPDGTLRRLTLDDEGMCIEPSVLNEAVRQSFAGASRTPDERYGDLRAQEAANHVGCRRLEELTHSAGAEALDALNRALLDYSERRMQAILQEIPNGTYTFEDALEDDGFVDRPIPIRLTLTVSGNNADFDFSESGSQNLGTLNAVRAITESAVFYCLRCLGGPDLPTNAGILRPVRITTRPGTIVDAVAPAAVSGGNVETSQRIVDVVFGALAQALPDQIPAASGGTMNNVLFGGLDEGGRPFVHYETLASGAGASAAGAGASAIHCHMTNTLNTPIEDLERAFPVRIETYSILHGNPADHFTPGGDGIVRHYRFLEPVEVTVLTERRKGGPYGLGGAPNGRPGRNTVIYSDGRVRRLASKDSVQLGPDDGLVIETPGGGGWRPGPLDEPSDDVR